MREATIDSGEELEGLSIVTQSDLEHDDDIDMDKDVDIEEEVAKTRKTRLLEISKKLRNP